MAMNRSPRHVASWLTVALAALAASMILAPAASAAPATGAAYLRLADHDRGRTLSGQGVTIVPKGNAAVDNGMLKLGIVDVDPGAKPIAIPDGWLRFQKGQRGVALTELRFDLYAGTLRGKLAGKEMEVFRLGAHTALDGKAGKVAVQNGKLRLIRDAAKILRKRLKLDRALRGDGVGMIWLAADAKPHRVAKKLVGGSIEWGIHASWRNYVLNVPPAGTISIADGATATGSLESQATTFGFPFASGNYETGLYGATDAALLQTKGSVTFSKPFHCIVEVRFSNLAFRLDGDKGTLLADTDTDINQPPFPCTDLPAVSQKSVPVASLDLASGTATVSPDARTKVWTNVPATLTEAGSVAFAGSYSAGTEIDPVTITTTTE